MAKRPSWTTPRQGQQRGGVTSQERSKRQSTHVCDPAHEERNLVLVRGLHLDLDDRLENGAATSTVVDNLVGDLSFSATSCDDDESTVSVDCHFTHAGTHCSA